MLDGGAQETVAIAGKRGLLGAEALSARALGPPWGKAGRMPSLTRRSALAGCPPACEIR